MNIYKALNELTKYIEDNLSSSIDYNKLANILAVNAYTMQKIFSLLTNIPLSEYIRNRRLSQAGYELLNKKEKIINLAIKYQYNNATSFSRAFIKFHGVKPSKVKIDTKIKNFPRIIFDENIIRQTSMEYSTIILDEEILYGIGIT